MKPMPAHLFGRLNKVKNANFQIRTKITQKASSPCFRPPPGPNANLILHKFLHHMDFRFPARSNSNLLSFKFSPCYPRSVKHIPTNSDEPYLPALLSHRPLYRPHKIMSRFHHKHVTLWMHIHLPYRTMLANIKTTTSIAIYPPEPVSLIPFELP